MPGNLPATSGTTVIVSPTQTTTCKSRYHYTFEDWIRRINLEY